MSSSHRRRFLRTLGGAALSLPALSSRASASRADAIAIDPEPLFEVSAHFHMQFMEPLGTTDASVEAAWSYEHDDWREDFVAVTRALAPDAIRFGGLLSRYYKWREGIGPPARRPWMRNYEWGGKETNRIGTHELVDLCRRTGAQPMVCVNFLGDGVPAYRHTREGDRTGDAQEAADWVAYANDPDHPQRRANGHADALGIRLWQIGNETSYGPDTFALDAALAHTVEFARAMRARDPDIVLVGWGDSGWARPMANGAGAHLDWIAAHMMQQRPLRNDTLLDSLAWQHDPQRAWEELQEMHVGRVEAKLQRLLSELEGQPHGLAITEGHLSLAPRNLNPILDEWLVGVYYARQLNLYLRHGARVRMCTVADFNGTRWTTNAVMHEVPRGVSYLQPAGAVMALFKRHLGQSGVRVRSAPALLDIAATRSGERVFLHVANCSYDTPAHAAFSVDGMHVEDVAIHEIAPEDPRARASQLAPQMFAPVQHTLRTPDAGWRFPPRSVSAIELRCRPAG